MRKVGVHLETPKATSTGDQQSTACCKGTSTLELSLWCRIDFEECKHHSCRTMPLAIKSKLIAGNHVQHTLVATDSAVLPDTLQQQCCATPESHSWLSPNRITFMTMQSYKGRASLMHSCAKATSNTVSGQEKRLLSSARPPLAGFAAWCSRGGELNCWRRPRLGI